MTLLHLQHVLTASHLIIFGIALLLHTGHISVNDEHRLLER